MALRKYNPVTAGTRWRIGNAYAEITTNVPEKSLLESISGTGGRNVQGRRSMRYIGGGNKKMYRIIDFKRNKFDIPATVKSIEYDPNRTAFIALLVYADGEKRYILAPQGLQVGAKVISGPAVAPEIGNALLLKNMPLGTTVHNIEIQPGQGGAIARSAGTYAQLSNKEEKYAGKAGRNRWKGIRPRNRGVAMNPVDHPMGGGEGKSSGGHPRSRTGKYAKGLKTRKQKGSDKLIIQRKNGKKL